MAGPKNKPLPDRFAKPDATLADQALGGEAKVSPDPKPNPNVNQSQSTNLSANSGQASHAGQRIVAVVFDFLSTRLTSDTRICVALSGGLDSVVLLHVLWQLIDSKAIPAHLSAVHVHHGINQKADEWANFCADLCRRLGISLQVVQVNVARDGGEGLEAAARRARYAAFADCRAEWLALAHHRDDQSETVLLNLLRGAGVAGAAGMLAERPQQSGPVLIRPLLGIPRQWIEDYAGAAGLAWVNDDSNSDTHIRRNFLRREILPRLDERFPGGRQSLARAAGHFAEARLLLDELAGLDRTALATQSGRIALSRLKQLSPQRARNLLRFLLSDEGFRAPDARWLEEAMTQLATAGQDSEICLRTADGELRVYRDELHILSLNQQVGLGTVIWGGEPEVIWGRGRVRFEQVTGVGLRADLLRQGAVRLQPRQGGERMRLDLKRPRRSLRNLLQESSVPPWERALLPYLWVEDQLAWVGGIGCDADWCATEGEAGLLPVFEISNV